MFTKARVVSHIDQVLDDDPRLALIALRQLLHEDVPWLERTAIRSARREGYEWSRIGRLLGRTRQAVRQRYGAIDGTFEPVRFDRPADGERLFAEYQRGLADRRRRQQLEQLEASGDIVPW
jgi:hypothetical protein